MMLPRVFGENLFDDWFDFPFDKEFFSKAGALAGRPEKNLMKADVKEGKDAFELAIDLPGFSKEQIKADLNNGYLTISASRFSENDKKDEEGNYVRRERYSGSCSRSFYVGSQVTEEDIKGKYENGILNLEIKTVDPKKKVEEKKYIAIEG
ncbi:MAG: Hsp20/alpha crystallin family protein [Lachnospiraceae bacterium]